MGKWGLKGEQLLIGRVDISLARVAGSAEKGLSASFRQPASNNNHRPPSLLCPSQDERHGHQGGY